MPERIIQRTAARSTERAKAQAPPLLIAGKQASSSPPRSTCGQKAPRNCSYASGINAGGRSLIAHSSGRLLAFCLIESLRDAQVARYRRGMRQVAIPLALGKIHRNRRVSFA